MGKKGSIKNQTMKAREKKRRQKNNESIRRGTTRAVFVVTTNLFSGIIFFLNT
jgi:hypothetical protein